MLPGIPTRTSVWRALVGWALGVQTQFYHVVRSVWTVRLGFSGVLVQVRPLQQTASSTLCLLERLGRDLFGEPLQAQTLGRETARGS